MKQENDPLVNIDDLKVYFGDERNPIRAVDGVTLSISAGEFVAFVGESGCGKSMTSYALTRLLPQAARWEGGSVYYRGANIGDMSSEELRKLRGGRVAYIFQEPGRSLNPVVRVGDQIAEAIRLHRRGVAVREEVLRQMQRVGLPDPASKARAYPHELSGGMQQRVMIAMALACEPELLVADEPTTALDVTIQAQIIDLLAELNQSLGMAVWLITHNLGLVRDVARRIYVMYAGRVVEEGSTDQILDAPQHPYTRKLIEAVPVLQGRERLVGIPGGMPSPSDWPKGCRFSPRCDDAQTICTRSEPEIEERTPGHRVACLKE